MITALERFLYCLYRQGDFCYHCIYVLFKLLHKCINIHAVHMEITHVSINATCTHVHNLYCALSGQRLNVLESIDDEKRVQEILARLKVEVSCWRLLL